MRKYSHQREIILSNLKSRRDHPTADMVYESVRKEQPNISLGTVYRNLALLADDGQILKLSTGNGPDHFDGFVEPHNHFLCRGCGELVDMDFELNDDIVSRASSSFDGEIDGYGLMFYGKCNKCINCN